MLHQDAARGRFCTIACAHVDLLRTPARVTVACGGHPLPVLRRADGAVAEVGAPGTLLGLAPDPALQDRTAELHPGDTLVLYTDGLTEARAPVTQWSPEELARAVAAAPAEPAALVDALVAAAMPADLTPRDDLAILALRLS
jgi:serine phosphatase RsbU (regulator of sigma subunit)